MRIALAAGDGIGPEIMDATLTLFGAAGVTRHLEFVPVEMGKAVFEKGNTRGITDAAVRTVEESGILFKGPMETPKGGGGKSINVTARKMWSAYANYRHFRTLPGVVTAYSKAGIDMNFSIIRENIEDTYGGIETRLSDDVFECKRLISAPGSDEVHRFAFETAKAMGITRVHCGHKANIMKMTDGAFLERFRAMAAGYPGIETGDVIVDALCMNLVMKPQQYQMVVLPNLQGDIVSDLAAGLVGGLGFAPSANIGRNISIFEAVHGTAPDIAGRRIANPTALVLSGLMMLRHVGLVRQAATIENALLAALEDGVHTGDFGDGRTPPVGTDDFVAQIVARLGKEPRRFPAVRAEGSDAVTARIPPRPTEPMVMRANRVASKEVVGVDVYLDTDRPVAALAPALQAAAQGTPFALATLSNRGTQLWPTGSTFTECVDCMAARFERAPGHAGPIGHAEVLALVAKLAVGHQVAAHEVLRTFDGARGYALAQGQ